jgi:hypothetical protein
MLSPHAELAAALRERMAIITDRELYARDPAAHLAALQAVSGRIDRAGEALPLPVDPRLAHFLEGASYAKALAWLEAAGAG